MAFIQYSLRMAWTGSVAFVVSFLLFSLTARSQSIESLDNGLKRLSQGPLTLITDLPVDDELRRWPNFLEQAIAAWSRDFQIPDKLARELHLTAYVIGDRNRFQSLGLLQGVPAFEDGYQLKDTIFLVEQPSEYYRRHLFLHEATHWIMYRALGGAGAPWFMEGMADLYGTHQVTDGKLVMGIIPRDPSQVPHWGRFKRLHEMIEQGNTPSLAQILNYSNDTKDRMDRYVWSWAASVFFTNHPEYRDNLAKAAQAPLDYSLKLSTRLNDSLNQQWPAVVADWNGFLTDFDFGYEPDRSMVAFGKVAAQPRERGSDGIECQIDSARGWQSSGVLVRKGDELSIAAEGTYTIAKLANGKAWETEPQGITLRYVNHEPLGRLVATIVPTGSDLQTHVWDLQPVGRNATLTAPRDGLLMLKINEPAGQLSDNEGHLLVRIRN